MQVFGSALAVVGIAWGLGKTKTLTQVFGESRSGGQNFYFVWIRWVVPIVLLVILISYIYSTVA